jgi:hypothetical protein
MEENATEAGMWRRLTGICRKLHEKVQQTWWRVRQWHSRPAAPSRWSLCIDLRRAGYPDYETRQWLW